MRGFAHAVATVFSKEIVTGGLDYFEYQCRVARDVVVPWLAARTRLDGARVGDFGCHEGGTLEGLRGAAVASAVGYEVNEQVVRASPFVPDERFRIEIADLMALPPGEDFDVVLLHDVLEHVVDVDGVLRSVREALAAGGRVFVSFPPYRSAFGGHQHLAAGWARAAPYIHYLPEKTFYRLAAPADNEYMTGNDSHGDLVSVRQTRLSLRKAEAAFCRAGFEIVASEFFLLRPEYTVRYGMPTISAGVVARVPVLRELLVNGAFYLLAATARAGSDARPFPT